MTICDFVPMHYFFFRSPLVISEACVSCLLPAISGTYLLSCNLLPDNLKHPQLFLHNLLFLHLEPFLNTLLFLHIPSVTCLLPDISDTFLLSCNLPSDNLIHPLLFLHRLLFLYPLVISKACVPCLLLGISDTYLLSCDLVSPILHLLSPILQSPIRQSPSRY